MVGTDVYAGRRSAPGNARRAAAGAVLIAVVACLATWLAAALCGPAAALGPPPKDNAAAVAGAKGALRRMERAKTAAQRADCLTNETAAMMGTMMAMFPMMEYGMAESFGQAPRLSARQKAERAQFQALVRRYGLDKMQDKGPESREGRRLVARGRRFLVDMEGFLARTGKMTPGKDKSASSPEAYRYKVLSPTRVALRDPKKPKEAPAEARWEDGAWRLHLPMPGAR